MSATIRISQRAPTACLRCSQKRIKCDKQTPCNNCLIRGLESSCARETVRVKGQVISNAGTNPSYAELQEENRLLKARLVHKSPGRRQPENAVKEKFESVSEILEAEVNFPVYNTNSSTIQQLSDIPLPSAACSRLLIEHGFIWTSWIHFAVHIPTFREEHDRCWIEPGARPLVEQESPWLALYFAFLASSLLFMDAKEADAAGLPTENTVILIRNWYDTSLFFLYKADYLRKLDFRTVQTIAVLLGLFKNLGDSTLDLNFLSIGIRIGQSLGMDQEPPTVSKDPIVQEVSRRVWWTLMICEWLQRPARTPCIRELDFTVRLPLDLDDEELLDPVMRADPQSAGHRPRPIQYHIAMIRLAQLTHTFYEEVLHTGDDSSALEQIVLQTDESLAHLIEQLPPHLSEDSDTSSIGVDDQKTLPVVLWQRKNLALSILFYRMAINRVLQSRWIHSADPDSFERVQAICLSCARAIVSLTDQSSSDLARHRPWATTSNLFSAAITLAVEALFSDGHTAEVLREDVNRCIAFFNDVRDQNALASRAIDVLGRYLSEGPHGGLWSEI